MISRQKLLQIVIIVLILLIIFPNFSRLIPERKNYENYMEALNQYNSNDYSNAYHTFGKVSRFSKLKSAAVFRQALCADKLGDIKTELNKYKEVIKNYPFSLLGLKAQYLRAQILYESKKFKKSQNEFKEILVTNPNTDYATAAQYFLGAIEAEKAKKAKSLRRKAKYHNRAIKYFKAYLKESPDGRFAINCVEKWTSFNRKLNNEDNLIIAKIYQANQDYKNAQKYLAFTNFSVSWPYFVKNAYAVKDFDKVKAYTIKGLKENNTEDILINEPIDEKVQKQNIYQAIDDYLETSKDPKTSISYLLSLSEKSKGYEYLLYKNCNNLSIYEQTACYNTLFYKYPKGQFAAEALSNIFYDKIRQEKYFMAKKLGKMHLAKYPNSNSSPRVMFWLAKTSERTKNYDEARNYYKNVIRQFPDDYYAYHAFLNLNRFRRFEVKGLNQEPIEFPYRDSNYGIITELAKVRDYGLINQLSKNDDFIQSWLAYLQGNFSASARLARDAIADLSYKPDRFDPRWRLAYPIHYYDEIEQFSRSWNNDPILILCIIREESYFNPKAQSAVGARGLMQLMPSTAAEASAISGISLPNANLLFDPYINIRLGNVYYSKLKRAFNGRDMLAVLAYNGGIGSVRKWTQDLNYYDADDFVEQIPYAETQNYLKKVYRSYWNYLRIYDGIR